MARRFIPGLQFTILPDVDAAFQMIRRIPHLEPPPAPQQGDLDELMHCIATGKQYVWEPAPPPNGS